VSEPKSPEHLALALFAEAIGDRDTRRANAKDPLQLLKELLTENGNAFENLPEDVQAAFTELFGDLSFEELRVLGRLQAKMVELDPEGDRGLTEVVIGSQHTVGKL
jgi:hypothetical protein